MVINEIEIRSGKVRFDDSGISKISFTIFSLAVLYLIRYTQEQVIQQLLKPVIFHPSAKVEIRAFPESIKKMMGELLFELQKGKMLTMPHSKPMPSVGSGVHELRVKGPDGAYRTFYYLKHADTIFILHCFKKKTQKTPLREIQKGIKNLKELIL